MSDHNNANTIAIIGMAGRFPGAKNIDELWALLKEGRHAITHPTEADMVAGGVDPAIMQHPKYVNTCLPLSDFDRFDAGFFGYSPRQATSLDPQGRLFLECAWESLEHAGYDPAKYDGIAGIFGGSGPNHYLQRYQEEINESNSGNWHQTSLDGDKDFLTMRVSYKLGLKGPSVAVQSACSSSLVAVHLACQSLLTFESDMVLAGGVSIKLNQHSGYLYEDGGINSRDGTCRAYDADATGAIGGSGCAIVVLKRLDDALRDGDDIHAVIRGTAVNNDGADKAGFSAPGVKAQSRLIASALAFAELLPTDIGMLEGHGTGTVLGDAVELTALNEAFQTGADAQKWCALGSIKTNIGHLDTASGVAGLIKAVLCLKHGHLVPSLNYARPNPAMDTPGNPFFVNTRYTPWPRDGKPRRAGVSSFGMGGTNAHAIVEEPPLREDRQLAPQAQVFPLSAHTSDALAELSGSLARHQERHSQLDLGDVAFTLQTGRRRFAYRRAVVAETAAELTTALHAPLPAESTLPNAHADLPVVFMFSGQGSQQPGAVQALYETDAFFRTRIDECARLFEARLGFDIRPYICGVEARGDILPIGRTLVTQPAVFTVGYCLAQLWMHWGVKPAGLVGHSLGEYIAACVAGVMPLADCVDLLARRAQLVAELEPGAMLVVRMPVEACQPLLAGSLCIAGINAPTQTVVSGRAEDVEALAAVLKERGVDHRRLPVSHAFHSGMMDAAMAGLEEAARQCRFSKPKRPYFSCVNGQADVVDAAFWARHLREPVHFQAGLANAVKGGAAILLEIGSGQALCSLARQQLGLAGNYAYLPSLPNGGQSGRRDLLGQLGQLWSAGADIDWPALHQGVPRRRVGLVPYPFQRQRYWIQPKKRTSVALAADEASTSQADDEAHAQREADFAKAVQENSWTELEATLAGYWREVLGVAAIRRGDSFVGLGGDSLIALRVVTRVNEEFGVTMSPRILISASGTVEALAAELTRELEAGIDAQEVDAYLATLGMSAA